MVELAADEVVAAEPVEDAALVEVVNSQVQKKTDRLSASKRCEPSASVLS